MSFKLRLIPAAAAVCVIAACGGGGAGAPPGTQPPATATPTSGVAVDGYISAATALCDANGNGTADAGEATAVTGPTGRYTFADGCNAVVVVTGGTDVDTGQRFRGVLKTPPGATVASPLTSLIVAGVSPAVLLASLGLPAATDLLNTDPALRTNGALVNAELLKKSLAVQQLLQQTTDVFAGLAGTSDTPVLQQIHAEVAAAAGVLLQGGGTLASGGTVSNALVASLVQAAANRVAGSSQVPAAVRSAVSALNAEALGVVVAGSLKLQAEALLQAADRDLVAVVTARQADTTTSTFVVANASQLTAAPTAATATLGGTLTALMTPGGSSGGGGGGGGAGTPVINFSATEAGLTAFGSNGGGYAAIAADPTDPANKVAKIVKRPGDEVWAGATVFANAAASSITPVALTAGSRTVTVRVYAPAAGAKVLLKLEQGEAGAADVQVEATTTAARAWETLTFTFPAAGTYKKLSLFPNFNSAVAAESVFYFDDITYPTGAVAPVPSNYLALSGDALSLVNGSAVTRYTVAQFQSDAGISLRWPLPSLMQLRLGVVENGSVALAAGQKLTAALAITETTASGKGELRGYIGNVQVTRAAAGGLTIAVPATGADALVYGVSTDARKKAVVDFGGSVAGVRNTLATAAGSSNDIVFGSVVNYAINQVSNDFTGIYSLRGKYRVSIVIDGLPLRLADGKPLPEVSISVPTALDATGGVAASKTVTGPGLVGYITLTD